MADQLVFSEASEASDPGRPRTAWRRIGIALIGLTIACLALLAIGWLLATSSRPWVAERPAPAAEQVGAGRSLLNKILRSGANGALIGDVTFDAAELDGFGALATDMFKPDRASARIVDGSVELTISHRMRGGRWLNVALRSAPSSSGFPPTRIKIGAIALGPTLSHWLIERGRHVAQYRGVEVPPLDQAIRRVVITPASVTVNFNLPGSNIIASKIAGVTARPVDSQATERIYCRLVDQQKSRPSADFTEQVRRTFASVDPGEDPVEQNRAAFVALSMLVVSWQAGDLAGSARQDTQRCRIDPPTVLLQKRPDSPKHWALSAALAAVLGSEPARAAGEWKELSDSLPKGARLDSDDGTGFSFVDIAADRSGFLIAQASVDPGSARRMTEKLADASNDELLPQALLREPEGLDRKAFRRAYGGIDQQRYAGTIAAMDKILETEGLIAAR